MRTSSSLNLMQSYVAKYLLKRLCLPIFLLVMPACGPHYDAKLQNRKKTGVDIPQIKAAVEALSRSFDFGAFDPKGKNSFELKFRNKSAQPAKNCRLLGPGAPFSVTKKACKDQLKQDETCSFKIKVVDPDTDIIIRETVFFCDNSTSPAKTSLKVSPRRNPNSPRSGSNAKSLPNSPADTPSPTTAPGMAKANPPPPPKMAKGNPPPPPKMAKGNPPPPPRGKLAQPTTAKKNSKLINKVKNCFELETGPFSPVKKKSGLREEILLSEDDAKQLEAKKNKLIEELRNESSNDHSKKLPRINLKRIVELYDKFIKHKKLKNDLIQKTRVGQESRKYIETLKKLTDSDAYKDLIKIEGKLHDIKTTESKTDLSDEQLATHFKNEQKELQAKIEVLKNSIAQKDDEKQYSFRTENGVIMSSPKEINKTLIPAVEKLIKSYSFKESKIKNWMSEKSELEKTSVPISDDLKAAIEFEDDDFCLSDLIIALSYQTKTEKMNAYWLDGKKKEIDVLKKKIVTLKEDIFKEDIFGEGANIKTAIRNASGSSKSENPDYMDELKATTNKKSNNMNYLIENLDLLKTIQLIPEDGIEETEEAIMPL